MTRSIQSRRGELGYDTVALVLQGGGALGSYQGGVYEGLAEAGLHPDWIAGISIGAINAAVIAGNPPERRVEQLQRFWDHICRPPLLPPTPVDALRDALAHLPGPAGAALSAWEAWRAVLEGQNGFFVPRLVPSWPTQHDPGTASVYDSTPLKRTLEEFVDFDRLNNGGTRISVGAVNVRTGNFAYFDNTTRVLTADHIMASAALPPGFAPVQIDGEYYWDGGVVSNTPLHQILQSSPRRYSLVFQVDLWSAHGQVPGNLSEVPIRQKDIQYSSRTRLVTDYMREVQEYRGLLRELLKHMPAGHGREPWMKRARELASDRRINVLHLIYRGEKCEAPYKDYQFGRLSMEERWSGGLADIRRTLEHPSWLEVPSADHPFVTHDVHRPPDGR
ncbi:patatin-like phospholipase family protein [Pigmentiphaga sp. H8]|uniref:patatin-like phospholipase family protein n=1 Tax=Pigmentiphaga sp. H8 TaxID=2488560 RepID=UPI001EDF5071|nr:patatin-like phospholipase family protein [Pigmentiphaga sp. H8]